MTETEITQLIEASGKSRSTVYRRLSEGWLPEEIIAGQRTDNPPIAPFYSDFEPQDDGATVVIEPDDEASSLKWARDVMWAADNIDTAKNKMTKAKAGSAARYNYYLLGKENPKDLLVNLVPKAINIIDKSKPSEGSDIDMAENKSIAELEELLKMAIAESQV